MQRAKTGRKLVCERETKETEAADLKKQIHSLAAVRGKIQYLTQIVDVN